MSMSYHCLLPVLAASALFVTACGGNIDVAAISFPPPPAGDKLALQPVFPQLTFAAPLAMLQAPADNTRWYVASQTGVIRVFLNQANPATSSVFADLRARVDDSASESGLLGLAFHPDFANNREVYVSYTRTGSPFESVVSRFTASSADQLNPASEEILLTVAQDFSNHNGGHLAFGPDGMLYVGFGDGGSGSSGDPNNRAQTTTNILGSIVRIDVDSAMPYAIPSGNPFAGNTECATGFGSTNCPEIYAFGLRNPWRFSFDRQGGALWAGDVGQNSFEEIDRIEAGMNYGWRQREGAHCYQPASNCSIDNVDPISEYGRSFGSSVTAGYVYRGSALPALVGQYVFGDFGSGRLFTVDADSAQGTLANERLDSTFNISSFGEGNDGELYVIDYASGTLHQIVAAP